MTTVYVREPGAVVRKRGERLVITKEDKEIGGIPLVNLTQVALAGNVQLTTPAAVCGSVAAKSSPSLPSQARTDGLFGAKRASSGVTKSRFRRPALRIRGPYVTRSTAIRRIRGRSR